MQLDYVVRPGAMGWLLVAASPVGVVAVTLGDEKEQVENDLQGRFPSARLDLLPTGRAHPHAEVLERYLRGETRQLELPLDVAGTAFQQAVWAALRAIPYGETRTYLAIAQSVGLGASAARAVGRAIASNPVALAIPCHRVVRDDGTISGYRWGVERKRALLELEGAPLALTAYSLPLSL